MSATTIPTSEQKQRAAWDLLLLDIETRPSSYVSSRRSSRASCC